MFFLIAFASAVDWTENWLRGLLCFHFVLFLIVCFTRHNTTIQSGLFLYICFLVLIAENLNTFCSQNWELFSTQNYFDTHGNFAAVVYAAPLLIIALLQMVFFIDHIECWSIYVIYFIRSSLPLLFFLFLCVDSPLYADQFLDSCFICSNQSKKIGNTSEKEE